MITPGVLDLGPEAVAAIVGLVRTFGAFETGNDPYHEHDFGCVHYGEQKVFWKIDYYDKGLEFGSPDPADPALTTRVLTIMLASEY